MKARPILFSGEMVRALLEGRKTQTRRVVKPQPIYSDVAGAFASWVFKTKGPMELLYPNAKESVLALCPYGKRGDRLWVRETWHWRGNGYAKGPGGCCYRADYTPLQLEACIPEKWTPAIHMFGWASRITLEITGVRVERLLGISEDDARAEGVDSSREYVTLWDKIHGAGEWDASPWVWVLSFKVLP